MQQHHKWVIFSDKSHWNVCSSLAHRLLEIGYQVEICWREDDVPSEEQVQKLLQPEVTTRVVGVNDGQILGKGSFHGVIFTWGMNTQEMDQRNLALPLLNIAKALVGSPSPAQLYVATSGVRPVMEDEIMENPTAAVVGGMIKCLKNEIFQQLVARHIDLEVGSSPQEMAEQILAEVALGEETMSVQVSYRGRLRYEPRLVKAELPAIADALKLPRGTDRYKLTLPSSKLIQDLEFVPLEPTSLGEDQVEVKVAAFGLNFRDIFTIIKPIADFEMFNTVGLDFAGVIIKVGASCGDKWKVGDRVFGANCDGSAASQQLPSHLLISSHAIISMPKRMTFLEAVTLPTTFLSAYLCLMHVAKMKKGDTVLIHTGSGGLGLAAIQLAKRVGAHAITTAGNPRKRAYLRSLGLEHVFHSRNTSFEQDIMRVTKGRGVDVVLNSITGPGIKEATLRTTAKNGRFVEMSKLNVWSVEEVTALRPDVDYKIVELTQCDGAAYRLLFQAMKESLTEGKLEPIPYTRFDAPYIRQALQYFQKAKHIGKVVIAMPEIKMEGGRQQNVEAPLFNPDSTYLITGGLGGIGFEVCKWMLRWGATDIVLMGRNPPKPEVAQEIRNLNQNGANVQVRLGDVASFDKCNAIIGEINRNMKPLRGVMHCAGVLRDNLYANQTWSDFETTYRPKVKGTWNLHHLTKSCRLEHFVVYSSVTALLGTPGQSNYSSANCFEDAFIQYRHSQGLPGTTINWGQWAQAGMAKELNMSGIVPVSVQRMLNGMEVVIRTNKKQVCLCDFESFDSLKLSCPSVEGYLDERIWQQQKKGNKDTKRQRQNETSAEKFWSEMDAAEGQHMEKRMEVMLTHLKLLLRQTLRLDMTEVIENETNLQEMGVDSLLWIELRNSIQTLMGKRLTVTGALLKNCETVDTLANALLYKILEQSTKTFA